VCEIAFWRGYVKGSFYARVFDDDGEPVAIAQSPYFRARGKEEPEATDEALLAYGALRTQLEHAGWEFASDGASWFATVFSRPQ
jgi:DNA-binding transcriptional LysR family regulator